MKPNDSATTGAAGQVLATHLMDGKELQAVVEVGPSGHILGSLDTWYVLADAVAFAANKQMLTIWNGAGSGKILRIRKMFLVNLQLVAATGVAVRLDVKRLMDAAPTGGTAITARAADTTNVALPAQVECKTGATATETNAQLLFPITCTNDEVGATQAFPSSLLLQATNWMPEGREIAEVALREGQGLTVKNITTTVIGSFGVLVVMTVE